MTLLSNELSYWSFLRFQFHDLIFQRPLHERAKVAMEISTPMIFKARKQQEVSQNNLLFQQQQYSSPKKLNKIKWKYQWNCTELLIFLQTKNYISPSPSKINGLKIAWSTPLTKKADININDHTASQKLFQWFKSNLTPKPTTS